MRTERMERETTLACEEWSDTLDASGDPSPETNEAALSAPPRSRVATETALGPSTLWAEHLMSLAVWPAALLTVPVVVAREPGRALPTIEGLVLGVLVAALLGYAIGARLPRALAYARRIPLVVLMGAAGGLGACMGALTMSAVVLASPLLPHAETWVLAGASFGLAYASLLLVPSVLARLGRLPGGAFALVRGAAMLVAGLYAGWNV
jgi:hypothetical protein